MIWFVGPSSYLYGSIDSTSDDVTITRLSFPEASAAVFPAASLLSAALPAAVVLDAEDPPQPARLAAIAAASATNKALFFISSSILLFPPAFLAGRLYRKSRAHFSHAQFPDCFQSALALVTILYDSLYRCQMSVQKIQHFSY